MLSSLSELITEEPLELQENYVEEESLGPLPEAGRRTLQARGVLSTQDALKAAEHGNSEILAAYLAAGGRPDAVSRLHHMGWSLLHLATGCALVGGLTTSLTYRSRPEPDVPNGFANCVSLLLAAGADPNVRSKQHGYTPLIGACLSGDAECCKLLLQAGAELEPEEEHHHHKEVEIIADEEEEPPPPPPPSGGRTPASPSLSVSSAAATTHAPTPQSPFEAAKRARFGDSRRAEVLAVLEHPPKLLPRSPLDTTVRLLDPTDVVDDRERSVEVRWRVPPSPADDIQRYVVRGFVGTKEIEVKHDAVGPGGHVRAYAGPPIQKLLEETNEKRREEQEKEREQERKMREEASIGDDDENPFVAEKRQGGKDKKDIEEEDALKKKKKKKKKQKKMTAEEEAKARRKALRKKKRKKIVERQEWPGPYACHLFTRPAPPGRRRDFCDNEVVDRGIALRQNLGLPVPTTASTLVHGLKPSLTYHFTVSCIAIIDDELRESRPSLPSRPLEIPNVDDDDWHTSEIIDKVLHYSAATAFGSTKESPPIVPGPKTTEPAPVPVAVASVVDPVQVATTAPAPAPATGVPKPVGGTSTTNATSATPPPTAHRVPQQRQRSQRTPFVSSNSDRRISTTNESSVAGDHPQQQDRDDCVLS